MVLFSLFFTGQHQAHCTCIRVHVHVGVHHVGVGVGVVFISLWEIIIFIGFCLEPCVLTPHFTHTTSHRLQDNDCVYYTLLVYLLLYLVSRTVSVHVTCTCICTGYIVRSPFPVLPMYTHVPPHTL